MLPDGFEHRSVGKSDSCLAKCLFRVDNRVHSHVPKQLSGPNVGFKFVFDGTQPVERIVAYATTEKDAIFSEDDFGGARGSSVRAFSGDGQELIERFRRGVKGLSHSVRWGTAEATIRLAGSERPAGEGGLVRVIVEMQAPRESDTGLVMKNAGTLRAKGLDLDEDYEPVPIDAASDELAAKLMEADQEVFVVRGQVSKSKMGRLEKEPGVIAVWRDGEVQPVASTCPKGLESCDCNIKAKGTLGDVAKYLGVDQVWAQGFSGDGIVVGVVDGGILAEGRDRAASARTPQVIGGWPWDWGTKELWDGHGNMCATDILGMAPNARILDMRVAGGKTSKAFFSNVIKAYHWAIKKHRKDGTPHVLSNSFAMFQERDDRGYA